MKELYLANIWPQIVTEKGVRLFEKKGYETSGNWLNRKNNYLNADRIVLPYADFGKPILITEATPEIWGKVVSYILFPDSLIGWDIKNKTYAFQKSLDAENIFLKSRQNLSLSDYASRLTTRTYGETGNVTIPLGVDTDSIKNCLNEKHTGLKILWNHMWRSDKGVFEAFDLIADFALKYPKVEFWIGQANTWNIRDNQTFIESCKPRLTQLQNTRNVKFFERIKSQKEYWSWFNQVDISFSTAFQEGFGLSMMEQEAAGIACVVPNAEVYPELHAGCLIVDRQKLSDGLQFLIENPNERKSVSQGCRDNASKYDTSIWVDKVVNYLG